MFLYYATDASRAREQLDYAWGDKPPAVRSCSGPDGGRGAVLSRCDPSRLGYYPDRQTWHEMTALPGIWIGYETLPGPDALAREELVPGYLLRLPGGAWRIPTAIRCEDGQRARGCLPVTRGIDRETGEIVRRVRREYEPVLLMADEVWDAYEQENDLTLRRAWDICVAALAINYRVGPDEVDALEVVGDAETRLILMALVDRMSWPDWQDAGEGDA